uniref:Uncharacterized protein n=1 Tax=Oryza sativa subsp. japonica TaxID=39947 RepID=Q6H839_ORYSJ|nr:hypothetical protein [Oryza sativa Japonica Group]
MVQNPPGKNKQNSHRQLVTLSGGRSGASLLLGYVYALLPNTARWLASSLHSTASEEREPDTRSGGSALRRSGGGAKLGRGAVSANAFYSQYRAGTRNIGDEERRHGAHSPSHLVADAFHRAIAISVVGIMLRTRRCSGWLFYTTTTSGCCRCPYRSSSVLRVTMGAEYRY